MDMMTIALLRKALFLAMLLGAYLFVDRRLLRRFDTAEAIKDDPKAIALLLGLLAVAAALA